MTEEERNVCLKQRHDRLEKENKALRDRLDRRSSKVTGLILELEDYTTCISVLIKQYRELAERRAESSFQTGQAERKLKPAFKGEVTRENIETMRKRGMSVNQIAETLGVSRRTIYNRLK